MTTEDHQAVSAVLRIALAANAQQYSNGKCEGSRKVNGWRKRKSCQVNRKLINQGTTDFTCGPLKFLLVNSSSVYTNPQLSPPTRDFILIQSVI